MTAVQLLRCDFCGTLDEGAEYVEVRVPVAMAPTGVEVPPGTSPRERISLHVCDGLCRGVLTTALQTIASARQRGEGVHYEVRAIEVPA